MRRLKFLVNGMRNEVINIFLGLIISDSNSYLNIMSCDHSLVLSFAIKSYRSSGSSSYGPSEFKL
jgi:hypothetical protein